jgi:hypothetical protein
MRALRYYLRFGVPVSGVSIMEDLDEALPRPGLSLFRMGWYLCVFGGLRFVLIYLCLCACGNGVGMFPPWFCVGGKRKATCKVLGVCVDIGC